MEIGIVGLPNVGKSTIFNVLTKAGAEVANYPFCTIEPNVGIVGVPDPRLDFLCGKFNPEKKTSAPVKFFDIAGLVKGASKGEGLGNQFLGNIKQVDAIAHIVRVFSDENVSHSPGKVDPLDDIETINTELMLSDLDLIGKNLEKIEKLARQKDKEAGQKEGVLKKVKTALEEGKPVSSVSLSKEEEEVLKEFNLLTKKPMLYVFNTDEDKLENFDETHKELVEFTDTVNSEHAVISAKIEADMLDLSPSEKADYIKELGFDYKGFDEFIRHAYHLLHLITFFTVGPKECRAWPIRNGLTADKAAGKIHSDMERGFIRGEVMSYEDFKKHGSEQAVKEAGRLRSEGREYVMQDGDIMYVRFNV